MKKLLVFIVLITSMKIFAQENTTTKEEIQATENTFDKTGEPAQFPGGINTFRNNILKLFNNSKINTTGLVKSEIHLIISEDGTVTDINIIGNNKSFNKELERVIKRLSKTKWEPAKIDGKPVKFRFKLPIALDLSE
ncbi:MAG: energy transducer TonB [Chryseobacterium sp.]|uniref:energy transducer TonB n=1 Tax=Chryseobacterium sp. TaxID=1871047 RepID=UPI001B248901|nr:energy transducer TonB [Chryseobacterium sp.]MBO6184956.1 energy transducer TonB [Chryseobacterium sp.]